MPLRLRWIDCLAVLLLIIFVGAIFFPQLPPGICLGDFGDLQLAARHLGIVHPPGYPLYAALLHIATWVPGVDDMFAISAACLLLGLVWMACGAKLLIRLGVNAWVAAAVFVLLCQYPRVRLNLFAPEVYTPTLAFLAVSVLLLFRYERDGRMRDILLAAFCFGVAAVSRPPVALAAPFFVAGWAVARSWRNETHRKKIAELGLIVVFAAVPAMMSVGYLLARDDPGSKYNYVDHFNADESPLPPVEAGFSARLERIRWLMSGAQFNEYLGGGGGPRYLRNRLNWLRGELAPYGMVTFILFAVTTLIGFVRVFRASRATGLAVLGLMVQGSVYVMIYHMHGQAADLLPVLFGGVICFAATVSWIFERFGSYSNPAAIGFFCLSCVWTFSETARLGFTSPAWIDGSQTAVNAQLDSLPQDAVILAMWDESVPFRFAQLHLADRPDIMIVTSSTVRWLALAERFAGGHSLPKVGDAGRPVFVSREIQRPEFDLEAFPPSSLWRMRMGNEEISD